MSTRGAPSCVVNTPTGLPRLHEQRLVGAELEQRADDRAQRLVVARRLAGAAVDDQLLRLLRHFASRLFSSMRSGASVDHCRAFSSVPRGARIDERSPHSASTRAASVCVTLIATPPLPPRLRRAATRRGSPSPTASMSGASDRSSCSRGESSRTAARVARTPAPGSSGAWNSTACAPASSSIASAALAVREHLPRLQPGRVSHRHVILLPGARRDRVDRRGMAEHLVLGDERRGHVLRDHEAAVQPAVGGEERRQPVGQVRVDEPLDAPLGDARELRRPPSPARRARTRAAGRGSSRWRRACRRRRARADCPSPRSARPRRCSRRSRAGRATRRAPAARSAASTRPAPCRTSGAPR